MAKLTQSDIAMYGEVPKAIQEETITFSTGQLQYLMKLFPQVALSANHTEADMRHYFGRMEVIQAIKLKTRGLNNAL